MPHRIRSGESGGYDMPDWQDAQKARQQGRSERRPEAYPLGYVEDLSEARTTLAGFFSILLKDFSILTRMHPRLIGKS